MGIQDRDWYAEDFERRQALIDKASKSSRRFISNRQTEFKPLSSKVAFIIILVFTILTFALLHFFKR